MLRSSRAHGRSRSGSRCSSTGTPRTFTATWPGGPAGRGRNWARILSTVLAGLATLQLGGIHGAADFFFAVLTWLTGLAAVWQLWRPAASAFFRPRALPGNDAP